MSSDRREKALSVFLSTIMVLSVVAMGMAAGFAGSAAAQDAENGSLFVASNEATSNQAHTINFIVGSDDSVNGTTFADSDSDELTIDYNDSSAVSFDHNEIDRVEAVKSDGTVLSLANNVADTASADTASFNDNGDGSVTISGYSTANNDNIDLEPGDIIRVVISQDVVNSNIDGNIGATVNVNGAGDTTHEFDPANFGTFTVLQDGSEQSVTYDSFQQAVEDANGGDGTADAVVVPEGEFQEELRQPVTLDSGLSTATVQNDDVNITGQGADSSVINSTAGNVITVGDNDDVVIQDLTISGQDASSSQSDRAVFHADDGDDVSPDNLIITGVEFRDFGNSNPVIELAEGDDDYTDFVLNESTLNGANAGVSVASVTNTLDINNNNLESLGSNNGIVVGGGSGSSQLNVTDNTVEIDTGGNAIDVSAGSATGAIDISNNDVVSDDNSGGTGIALSNGGDNALDADIEGGSIDNVSTGISTSSFQGDFLNITDVSLTNVGSSQGINVDGSDNLGTLDVNGVSIDGDNSSTTAINVDNVNGASEVVVADATIDSVDVGVAVQDSSDASHGPNFVNVTGSTFTDIGSTIVDLTNDLNVGNSANGEAVNIDQATIEDSLDATVVDIGTDGVALNVTSSTVTDVDVGVAIGASVDDRVKLLSNSITNATTAVDLTGTTDANLDLDAHFNTLEDSDTGVSVNSITGVSPEIDLTFNDFVNSSSNGLNVANGDGTSTVNANYSWWDNRDSSRIVGPYTLQDAESQLLSPRRVYSYTRLHTGGQP